VARADSGDGAGVGDGVDRGGHDLDRLPRGGGERGQPRTTPVILIETDAQRWLVSPRGAVGLVHNVRATPEVSPRRGKTTEVLYASDVDAVTAGPVLQRYVRDVRVTAPFFDAKADDPVELFVNEASRHPVFRLTGVR